MTLCATCWVRGPNWSTGRIAREGIESQPEPEHLCAAAQPGAQFVHLEVWALPMARCERSCKV